MYGGEPHTVFIRCWLRDETMTEMVMEPGNPGLENKAKQKSGISFDEEISQWSLYRNRE